MKKFASMFVVAIMAMSCHSEVSNTTNPSPTNSNEVSFAMPIDATRTMIGEGGETRWAPGDELAVWAKDAEGNYTFSNAPFMLRYFSPEWDKAYFAGNVAAMAEGDYTYYISYPRPTSVEGTMATYRVAAEQSGAYDGKYDIMVAEPVVAESLTTGKRTELNTIMCHQMHAIKITIPEGRNLYGDRFYRLEITFPNDVVGDITLDITDPNAEPIYSNTSNVVVLESAEGFDAGSEIWAFVLPGTVEGDINYFVKGEVRKSNPASYSFSKEFVKGHITPIRMAIPEIYPYYTAAEFTIANNFLGEEYNTVTILAADGTSLGTFDRSENGKYLVYAESDTFDVDVFDNTTWKLVFDSENAIVVAEVPMGDMTDFSEHFYTTDVPYLFAEDFSKLATFDAEYTDGPYTSTDGAITDGYDLSQYGIASGWSGARAGCDAAGTAILVAGRVDCVILGATRAYGRLDSPAISNIKEGKNVKVMVTFDYGGSRSGSSTYYPVGRVGYTTEAGLLPGYATQFSNDEAFANIEAPVAVPSIPTSGSATGLTQSMTYTINNCTSSHRISWHVGHMGYKNFKIDNGYGWMYVDNVKVQIVK